MAKIVKQVELPRVKINELPVAADVRKAMVVSVAAMMLLGLGVAAALLLPKALTAFLAANRDAATVASRTQLDTLLYVLFRLMGALSFVCAVCGVASLVRRRLTYSLLRASLAVVYPLVAAYVLIAWHGLFAVLDLEKPQLGGMDQDRITIIKLWWHVSWPAVAVILYTAWLHVMLRSRSVFAAFTGVEGAPMDGDRVLEDLRTNGREPRVRKSFYASAMTHLMVLVIIPWLSELGGCVTPYRVPPGSGEPVVAMVKMVKPVKIKKKKMTLRADSAIVYDIPDLDNTEVDQQIEQMSTVQYTAMANAKAGKMGKGGGTQGGWPEGMDDYLIRFIRLDHRGNGWDDGMDETGADINFLRAFAQLTGFKKIASKGESHPIRLLAKYPKDGFPPFVFITGNGALGPVSQNDIKILREYCLNGGMLIGDAGSADFHRTFISLMRRVFPDKPLIDIADDDILFQIPYGFPNGAPAFWNHGGRRAFGIKHDNRWVVFYHPGDMNDAWKSPAYSDVKPEMRDAAIQLGINIVYYAFNQWDDFVAKARK
jgi:hypothetical protein